MKTNKHLTLSLVNNRDALRAKDIVTQFGYSAGTARSYLSYLTRQGLLIRTVTGYKLSEKGQERLQYFDAMGCASFDCPLCAMNNVDHFTCPRCDYDLPKAEAKILPEWDAILWTRHAGVYCPFCQKLIFSEKQAQLLGIPREA